MSQTTVYDYDGLMRLFAQLAGRKLIGVVGDGSSCVELVFEARDDHGPNLVSIFVKDHHRGQVALGGVSRELIEAGYGTGELSEPE